MAPKAQPAWQIYREQMEPLCHGDALWEPAPTSKYTRVKIGDVGFIRGGRFHLLFSAGSPLGGRKLGSDVPSTFEQLDVGTPESDQPRRPGCVGTPTVQQVGAEQDSTISATLPLQPDADFSFELTEERGAALVTRHPTYKEDTQLDTAFKEYTVQHYKSWVKFARDKKYGDNLKPVLVSGFDMTRDFAMVAYSDRGTSVRSDNTLSIPMFGSVSASSWGTWRARFMPHTNHGPQQCIPPSRGGSLSSQPQTPESHSTEFNQCVFVRYYTMRLGLFPKVIRANAGPHDLGSGENRENALPEVMVGSDAGSTTTVGEGPERQWDHLAGNDASDELDVVVHNVPYDNDYDSWDAIADYVFQHSNATSVLMHHLDLAGIHATGGEGDISLILQIHKPRIVVNKDGVGRIICDSRETTLTSRAPSTHSMPNKSQYKKGRETALPSRTVLMHSLPNDSHDEKGCGETALPSQATSTHSLPNESQDNRGWSPFLSTAITAIGLGSAIMHMNRAARPLEHPSLQSPNPGPSETSVPETGLKNDVHYPLGSLGPSSSTDVLSWTSNDPRQSYLFNFSGVVYRFQTDISIGGQCVTSLWRAIRANKEERVAKLEWASNGGLGRATIGKTVVPMADLVRKDHRDQGWRVFDGPDGYQYRWGPSPPNDGDAALQDPNGNIIARLRSVKPTKYSIGDVYRELHYIPSAGAGLVMHPPLTDTVTVTALLYLFVTAWGL